MKTKRPFDKTLRSFIAPAASLALLLACGQPFTASAVTYTYNNTTSNSAPGTSWSAGTNWNAVPVSGSTTALSLTGTVPVGATIFTNNDIAGNFQLNSLSFTYALSGSGTAPVVTISGNPLEFITNSGTAPTVTINSSGTVKPTLTINNALVLTDTTTVAATTNGTLAGAISGAGGLAKSGAGTLTLSGSNTYTGATSVTAGILKLGNAGAFGNGVNNTSSVTIGGSGILDFASISPTANVALTMNSNANANDVGAIENSTASTTSTFGGTVTLQQQTRFGGGGAMLFTGSFTGNGVNFIKDSTGLLELQNSGNVTLGTLQANRGTIQVDSGTVLNVTQIAVGTGNSVGSGLTLNGGSVTASPSSLVRFGQGSGSASGSLTLNSGTLTVPSIVKGSLTFNATFNGGTLKANADSASFFAAASSANVMNGGALIDDGGFAITIARALTSGTATDGGLTKSGVGTLTLTGSNTYLGATSVNAGTLKIAGSVGDTVVTVTSNASLGGEGTTGAASSVTFNDGSNLRADGSTAGALTVGGNLTLSATTNVILDRTPTTTGIGTSIRLLNYNGALAGNDANLALQNAANYRSYSFSTATANQVNMTIDTKALIWSGTTAAWDINSSANWNSGADTFYQGDAVTFNDSGTNKAVTLDAAVTPATVNFNNTTGNDHSVSGTGSIASSLTKTNNGVVTIATPIVNSSTVTVTGGALNLSGTSTYTGATTVSGGALTVSGALGSGGGGTAVTTSNAGTAFSVTNTNGLTGASSLTVGASTTATLFAANNYTGATNVTGTLQLQNAGAVGSSAVTLNSGSVLQLRADSNTTFTASSFNFAGSGTVNYNFDVNNITSGTTGRTLILANVATQFGPASTTDTFNLRGGNGYTLQIGSGSGGSGALNIWNNTTINSNSPGVTLSIPGGISVNFNLPYSLGFGGAGNINVGALLRNGANNLTPTFNGTGTVTLTGSSNFGTAAMTVNNGIVRVNGTTNATSPVNVNGGAIGGTGRINGAVTINGNGGVNLVNGLVGTLTTGSDFTITGAAGANNLRFDLGAGAAGTDKIVVTGSTTVTNAGAAVVNLNQIGGVATPVNSGTYTLIQGTGSMAAVGQFALATSMAFGQTFGLVVAGNNLQLTTAAASAGPAAAWWAGGDDNWSTAANWNTDATSGSPASGAPGYQTNVNFYTTSPAAANLTTNVLDVDFDINSLTYDAAATSATTIGGTKMLTIEATNANGNAAGNGITVNTPTSGSPTQTISANVGLASSQTWTVNSGAALTVSGAITDFGAGNSLTKSGDGTLTLSASNSYSGGTTITSGTLNAGAAGALSSGVVANNSTLDLTAGAVTYTGLSTSLSGTGTVNVTLGVGTGATILNGDYSAFTGTWNIGTGAAAGAGKVQMNGLDNAAATINVLANGTVYVSAGTHTASIVLNGGDTGEVLGQLRVDSGATWAGPVTLAGNITGSGDATIGTNSGTGTISGVISQTGGARQLIKSGPGTTVLSGSNTYTGFTSILQGNLSVSEIGNGGQAGNLGKSGVIRIGLLGVGGGLIYTGTGETSNLLIDLWGTTGGTTLTQSGTTGALKFTTNFSATGSGVKTLTLNGSTAGTGEIAGAIIDSGTTTAVTKAGTGKWTLSGSNTYTGLTNVTAGTLAFDVSETLIGGLTVGTSGTAVLTAHTGTVKVLDITGLTISGTTPFAGGGKDLGELAPAPVPEPGTIGLLAVGAIGGLLLRRRNRKRDNE